MLRCHRELRLCCLVVLAVAGCAQAVQHGEAQPPPDQDGVQARKVIQRVSMEIRVDQLSEFPPRVTAAVDSVDGYIASSSLAIRNHSCQWTIRVPEARLSEFLTTCAGFGTVLKQLTSAEDVTDQFIDVNARLATKRLEEERLQKLLVEQTGVLSDVLEVERELSRVRGEIEQAQGRQRFLEHSVAFATVELLATEQPADRWTFQQPLLQEAVTVLYKSCSVLVTVLRVGLLAIIALAPWAGLAVVPAGLVWWLLRRGRKA